MASLVISIYMQTRTPAAKHWHAESAPGSLSSGSFTNDCMNCMLDKVLRILKTWKSNNVVATMLWLVDCPVACQRSLQNLREEYATTESHVP